MNNHTEQEQLPFGLNVAPELKNGSESYDYDRAVLARQGGGRFLRQSFPFELPPGIFEKLSAGGRLVSLVVEEVGLGIFVKDVYAFVNPPRGKPKFEEAWRGKIIQGVSEGKVWMIYGKNKFLDWGEAPRIETWATALSKGKQ